MVRFRRVVGVFLLLILLGSDGCRRVEKPVVLLDTPTAESQSMTGPPEVPFSASLPQVVLPPSVSHPTVQPSLTSELPLPTSTAKPLVLYTVTAGDTLLSIALRFGVPMAAIQLENNMGATTVVRQGDQLRIPATMDWEGVSPYWILYEVGSGETLSTIADRYALTVDALLAVNHLTDPDLLQPGQLLILPLLTLVELNYPVAANSAQTPIPEPLDATPLPSLTPSVTPDLVVTPTPTVTPGPVPIPDVSDDLAALAQRIFALINEQRAQYGLGPLAWNDILARAAQRHAEDCYARGWCDHVGSDGATYKERIIREGYDPVRWSECWAWYGTPELAVAMWMDEVPPNDPHRRTILSTYLTEVGVGVMPGNGHGYYFIADFGTPRE